MHNHKKINPFSRQNNDTGFGNKTTEAGGRFINKDGTYNLVKEGMPFWRKDLAYFMICLIFHDGNSLHLFY